MGGASGVEDAKVRSVRAPPASARARPDSTGVRGARAVRDVLASPDHERPRRRLVRGPPRLAGGAPRPRPRPSARAQFVVRHARRPAGRAALRPLGPRGDAGRRARRAWRAHEGRPSWGPLARGRGTVRGDGHRAGRRPARRTPVHAGHPSHGVPVATLDDAHVRGLRRCRGHERALPQAAGRRPDRPLDRLRHADALRVRHRRPRGRGRVRHVWRRGQQPRRHGAAAERAPARPGVHVDDDQLPGRPDLGDVHRGRREGGRPARAT